MTTGPRGGNREAMRRTQLITFNATTKPNTWPRQGIDGWRREATRRSRGSTTQVPPPPTRLMARMLSLVSSSPDETVTNRHNSSSHAYLRQATHSNTGKTSTSSNETKIQKKEATTRDDLSIGYHVSSATTCTHARTRKRRPTPLSREPHTHHTTHPPSERCMPRERIACPVGQAPARANATRHVSALRVHADIRTHEHRFLSHVITLTSHYSSHTGPTPTHDRGVQV